MSKGGQEEHGQRCLKDKWHTSCAPISCTNDTIVLIPTDKPYFVGKLTDREELGQILQSYELRETAKTMSKQGIGGYSDLFQVGR